jgi:hypothetical protein
VFLDPAGLPLRDAEVAPAEDEEVAVTAPAGATRVSVEAIGVADLADGPTVAGWQSGTLLAQVGRTALLAPGASVHLPAPLLTRRDGQRTAQALVRAATVVGPAASAETRLPATVEVVVVIADASPGTEPTAPPEVHVDGAECRDEPTAVLAGHRLYLAYALSGPPSAGPPGASERGAADPTALGAPDPTPSAGVTVRVVTGGEWQLAGVVGGAGTVEGWLPAITGAGSGVAVAPPVPAAPVTIRYEAPRGEAP